VTKFTKKIDEFLEENIRNTHAWSSGGDSLHAWSSGGDSLHPLYIKWQFHVIAGSLPVFISNASRLLS
jgi:hypothetical protein